MELHIPYRSYYCYCSNTSQYCDVHFHRNLELHFSLRQTWPRWCTLYKAPRLCFWLSLPSHHPNLTQLRRLRRENDSIESRLMRWEGTLLTRLFARSSAKQFTKLFAGLFTRPFAILFVGMPDRHLARHLARLEDDTAKAAFKASRFVRIFNSAQPSTFGWTRREIKWVLVLL